METTVWVPAAASVLVAAIAGVLAWVNARDPHRRLRSALELRDKLPNKTLVWEWDTYIERLIRSVTAVDSGLVMATTIPLAVINVFLAVIALSVERPARTWFLWSGIGLTALIFIIFAVVLIRLNEFGKGVRRAPPTPGPEPAPDPAKGDQEPS